MNKFKTFIIGVFVGSMLVGGVSYASDRIQIEVQFPKVFYWLDGKKIEQENSKEGTFMSGSKELPLTILYKGTSYVPVRFFAEALGKEIAWNDKSQTVNLSSVEQMAFKSVEVSQSSAVIQAWVERSKTKKLGQIMTVDDETYILVSGGEKDTGGYDVQIQAVKKYSERMTVIIEMTNPPKGAIVFESPTYPYHLVKIKGTVPGPVQFVETDGQSIPKLIGLDHLPAIHKETENAAFFSTNTQGNKVVLKGAARSFEGLLKYSLIDELGQVYEKGSVQALGPAPNWGLFIKEFELSSIHPGMSVIFHTLSSKDGLAEEMLTVKLDSLP